MANLIPKATLIKKDLRAATADLYRVNWRAGFWRFSVLAVVSLCLIVLAWKTTSAINFWFWTTVAGIAYAFWLICTHDAIHHTLLGCPLIEEGLMRLISWPILWPVGVYSELHRLHHGWNGIDLRDPERVQWTLTEYQQAPFWLQWYVRHQWLIDIFILGGLGLIAKTLIDGLRLQALLPRLKLQILSDLSGILIVQLCLAIIITTSDNSLLRYWLFWFFLERIIGVLIQTRAHLEHYGLWGKTAGHQLTQLYACRNLHVNAFTSWLMGGLNYHAVHHAFPCIPFDRLAIAHQRIQTVLERHKMPLMQVEQGYLRTTLKLLHQVNLIDAPDVTPDWVLP